MGGASRFPAHIKRGEDFEKKNFWVFKTPPRGGVCKGIGSDALPHFFQAGKARQLWLMPALTLCRQSSSPMPYGKFRAWRLLDW